MTMLPKNDNKTQVGIDSAFQAGNNMAIVTKGLITAIEALPCNTRLNGFIESYLNPAPFNFMTAKVGESNGLLVKRVSVFAGVAGSGGGTGTVVRLSNGVINLDTTLPPGSQFVEATFSQQFAQGNLLTLSILSDDNGTTPTEINVIVEGFAVPANGRLCGFNKFVNNSAIAINIAEMVVEEPNGIYVKRVDVDFLEADAPSIGTRIRITDGTTNADALFQTTSGNNSYGLDISQLFAQSGNTINTGLQTFIEFASPRIPPFGIGTRVRAVSAADATNFMEGVVTTVGNNQVEIDVDTTGGSGTFNDFQVSEVGYLGQFFPTGSVLIMSVLSDTSFGYTGMNAVVEYAPASVAEFYTRYGAEVQVLTGLPKDIGKATIDDNVEVTQLSVVVADVGSGGSTGTTFQVSDGITPIQIALPPGSDNATAAFTQAYPAGSVLTLSALSDDNGTPPTRAQLVVANKAN